MAERRRDRGHRAPRPPAPLQRPQHAVAGVPRVTVSAAPVAVGFAHRAEGADRVVEIAAHRTSSSITRSFLRAWNSRVRIVSPDSESTEAIEERIKGIDGYRLGADGKPVEGRRGGLGLPLARQLIEAHGGRLDMQSEKGTGTTATVSLP